MSNHTWRYKDVYFDEKPGITSERRSLIKHDNGITEVAVTSVDSLFEDGFIFQSDKTNATCSRINTSMNKKKRWQQAVEVLEATAISVTTRFDRKQRRSQIVYTVPIVGYRIFQSMDLDVMCFGSVACINEQGKLQRKSQLKVRNAQGNYLFYKGAYYDVSFAYQLTDSDENLKQLFPLKTPSYSFNNKSICKFKVRGHDSFGRKIPNSKIGINHETEHLRGYHWCGGWAADAETLENFLEIDLGKFKYVTHIGSTGEFPELDSFPKYESYKEQTRARKEQSFKMTNKNMKSYVYILKHESFFTNTPWVTEYEVSYRHYITRKWIVVGKFQGNSDGTTEHINELFQAFNRKNGLFTRYLRIRPLAFNRRPVMRIAVYGHEDNSLVFHSDGISDSSSSNLNKAPTKHNERKRLLSSAVRKRENDNTSYSDQDQDQDDVDADDTWNTQSYHLPETSWCTGSDEESEDTDPNAAVCVVGGNSFAAKNTSDTSLYVEEELVNYVVIPSCDNQHDKAINGGYGHRRNCYDSYYYPKSERKRGKNTIRRVRDIISEGAIRHNPRELLDNDHDLTYK